MSKPDLTSDSKQTFVLLQFLTSRPRFVFVCLYLCLRRSYEDKLGRGESDGESILRKREQEKEIEVETDNGVP